MNRGGMGAGNRGGRGGMPVNYPRNPGMGYPMQM